MVALNDFLPGGGVASDTATDQQANHLGIVQTTLRGNPGLRRPGPTLPGRLPSTAHWRYVNLGSEVLAPDRARNCSSGVNGANGGQFLRAYDCSKLSLRRIAYKPRRAFAPRTAEG